MAIFPMAEVQATQVTPQSMESCRKKLESSQRGDVYTDLPEMESSVVDSLVPEGREQSEPLDLMGLEIADPVMTKDFSFKHAFLKPAIFNQGEMQFFVNNDTKEVRRAIKLLVIHLFKGSKVKRKKLQEAIKQSQRSFESHFGAPKKRGFLDFLKGNESKAGSIPSEEEIAFFTYIGDKEVGSRILVKPLQAGGFLFKVKTDRSLVSERSIESWDHFSKKHRLNKLPPFLGFRVPNRLVVGQTGNFSGLVDLYDRLLRAYPPLSTFREEGVLSQQINHLNQMVITDIYRATIHQKIGIPGRYQHFDKDLSMGILLGLEKNQGSVKNIEELIEFVDDYLPTAWRKKISQSLTSSKAEIQEAIQWEFQHLQPYSSRSKLHSVLLHLKHPQFGKRFAVELGFYYQYEVKGDNQWGVRLVGGSGFNQDLYVLMGPDLNHPESLITNHELETLSGEISEAFTKLLDFEKKRNEMLEGL